MNKLLELWRTQGWELELEGNEFTLIFDLKEQVYLVLDIDDNSSITFDLSWDGITHQINLLEIMQDFMIVGEFEEDTVEFSLHEFITTMYAELDPKDQTSIVNENGFKLNYVASFQSRNFDRIGAHTFSIDVNLADKTITTMLEFEYSDEGEDKTAVYDISGFVNEANELLRKDR